MLILERIDTEARFRIFDFGPGKGHYKSMFSTRDVLGGDIYYFRWGLRNVLTVCSHTLLERISVSVGNVLERLGLKRGVRHLLRRWL